MVLSIFTSPFNCQLLIGFSLTGANNSIIGSVLMIPVGKGDQISVEVYAKYLAATTTSNPSASIANALIGAITGNTGTSNYEGVINGATVNSDGSLVNALGNGVSSTEPKAFINLMFLTDDASEIGDFAYKQVTSSSSNTHTILALDQPFEAPSAGYIVVYLSNESSLLTEVYFDDLKVTVNESKVIQEDDYYPFGLTFSNGYSRPTNTKNMFLYNGKELEEELDVNWYAYGQRNYDATLGRFFNQDRFADKYFDFSPYQYAANNPAKYIDVNGDSIWINFGDQQRTLYQKGNLYTQGKDGLVEYKGDDKFVSTVASNLGEMAGTEIGQSVLKSLSSSKSNFSFVNKESSGGKRSAQFVPDDENGGGTIKAAVLLGDRITNGQKLETTAHELFHGYQIDNGQNRVSTNNEVGAYLYGRGVSLSAGYVAIISFGNNTVSGSIYNNAMNNLMFGNSFNRRSYINAVESFRKGSIVNKSGAYNNVPDYAYLRQFQTPLISNFYPLVR